MTTSLWSLLRCPACIVSLNLQTFSERNGETDEGLLRCPTCKLWFPVVRGIPRIFIGPMRTIYAGHCSDFLRAHDLHLEKTAASAETAVKLSTMDSFGYEWTRFHHMLPEWQRAADFYFEPVGGSDALAGKVVLDAGCGKARQAYYAIRSGARLVGVDLSQAIDVARNNCSDLPGERLFVQADLMNLPFAPDSFDTAYSLGVLHHLPAPEDGFRRLVQLVRPGGRVLIYVYHSLKDNPLKYALLQGVTALRRLTTRMDHRVLLPVTTALGYGLYGGFVLPYKLLSRIPPLRPVARLIPFKFYADYPVHSIVNDQFDRFSAPIENRYQKHDVERWLTNAGLAEGVVLGGAGWRAAGRKNPRATA